MKIMDRFTLGLGIRQVVLRQVTVAWVVASLMVLAQPLLAGWVAATGGTETSYIDKGVLYQVHTFTNVGIDTLTFTAGGSVEYLIVGGGGGGGRGGSGIVIIRYPEAKGTCIMIF